MSPYLYRRLMRERRARLRHHAGAGLNHGAHEGVAARVQHRPVVRPRYARQK
jgi:hypothetical protein